MKLITRDTDYAVRALCRITDYKEQPVSVDELTKSLKIPKAFLRKILQVLSKEKILRSYKGKGGGFILAVSMDKIYLKDLMDIFQGPIKLNECIFKKKICPNIRACPLRKKVTKIERYVFSELKSITLASLF